MVRWFLKWLVRPFLAAIFGTAAVQGADSSPAVGLMAGLMTLLTAVWMIVDILDRVSYW